MLPLGGCTNLALRDNTVRTTNTLTDLHYKQVLDNVARFQANPETIPSFAVVSAGTVSVNDQASGGFSPTYAPTLTFAQQGGGPVILQLFFPFTGQRSLTENWSLTPITDADNLTRLRTGYQFLVMGEAAPNYLASLKEVRDFLADANVVLAAQFPPRGWYGVGRKADVPKDACHVGCYGGVYVWVTPEGMNGLALFTLAALDLATGKPQTPERTVVRRYKGESRPENLVETTITSTEPDMKALEAIRKGQRQPPPPRRRITEGIRLNPGLFQLPPP